MRDTIVAWNVTGESIDGVKTYVMGPNNKYNKDNGMRDSTNSEIYEEKINKVATMKIAPCSNDYCVLSEQNQGVDLDRNNGFFLDFLQNIGTFPRTGDDKINKPVLKLAVINTLLDVNSQNNIPYLEYQILTDSSFSPPADSSQTITAEGYSGEFKQVLEVKQPQESGLLEYVIQQ